MRTPTSALRFLASLLGIAAQGLSLTSSQAQNSISNLVPMVSIRAPAPETREPFCDPAICDAALPAPGVFVVSRRGGDLTRELFVSLGYSGTATSGMDYPALPGSVVFRAGQASVELLVEAVYDRLPEGDEYVVAQVLADPTMGPIERYRVDATQASARVIIHDNEATVVPVVSLRGGGVAPELCPPNADCAGIEFVLKRTGSADRPLTVRLGYGGTATPGVDYRMLPDTATFPVDEERITLLTVPIDDALAEGDEMLQARLLPPDPSAGDAYQIDPSNGAASATILDNEAPSETVVSIEATSPIAEESSYPYRRLAFRGRFTISRTGPTNNALTVFVHYGGSATQGVDCPFLPWIVQIPAGTNRIDIELVPNADDLPEPIEVVEATLSECPPLTVPPLGIPCYYVSIDPARASARVFIRDDGITTASLELTAPRNGAQFTEGAPIRIAATAIDLEGAITHVDFFDGERKIGESTINFFREPDPGTPVFHEFEWRVAATGSHSLTAHAVNAGGNAVTSAPVRIRVGEGLPVVTIETTVLETAEPSSPDYRYPGVFTLRRTGFLEEQLRVFLRYGDSPYRLYATASPGLDYVTPPPWVDFPSGTSAVEVAIVPLDDGIADGVETVWPEIVAPPTNLFLKYQLDPARNRAQIIIHDADLPTIAFEVSTLDIIEPAPDGYLVPWVPFKSIGIGAAQTIHVQIGGTATEGLDYYPLSREYRYPLPGVSTGMSFMALPDAIRENNETIIIKLVQPESGNPGYLIDPLRDTLVVTIHDSPPLPVPVVKITATRAETAEPFLCRSMPCPLLPEPAPGLFTITRSAPLDQALEVYVDYRGTAKAGDDYLELPGGVVIPAGRDSLDLEVVATADDVVEGDETVVAEIRPDRYPIFPDYLVDLEHSVAQVTIHDRTPPLPVVSIVATDPFAREGASKSDSLNTATFLVSRVGLTNDALKVRFTIVGTALNGVDYEAIKGPLTIPAGQRSARLVVRPIDDNRPEPVETILITLLSNDSTDPGYALGRPHRAAAILVDNDRPRPLCLRLPDGLFNVCVPMDPGHCFRVESTRDFKEWTPLCTVPVDEGVAHYVDPDAPDAPRQFYRLVPVACEPEE